jgi:hypothetical protein
MDGWAWSVKDHREWMRNFYHSYKGQEDRIYEITNAGAPLTILLPVSRLLDDLVFLQKFFEPTAPTTHNHSLRALF